MYKNTKPLPDSFKIKVNPDQSKALQEHLISNGKYWMSGDKNVKCTENKYLYFTDGIGITITILNVNWYFKRHKNQRIRFKDYFAKEIFTLPEKWCIEVTQDNCNELNVWLHRNWKDYEDYKDTWEVTFDNESDLFFSSSKSGWNKRTKDVFYELITTEQFRKQFGMITETKQDQKCHADETKGIEKDLEFWKTQAKHYKQRCRDLRLKNYHISKENKSLKTTIEAIKEIIQDNPIIKK